MSTLLGYAASVPATMSGRLGAGYHQFSSWQVLFDTPLRWAERRKQRNTLGDLIDDARMLNDIGLTREQALREVNKPFWR
jgi:uncharacterized protein YjiS (DUF1127 family)